MKINETMVIEAIETWAKNLINIGVIYTNNGDYKSAASKMLDDLYAYQEGIVLFKPTRVTKLHFRFSKEDAMSYFVKGKYEEDKGFALEPWTNIRVVNHGVIIDDKTALASGLYYFTSNHISEEIEVEYTFGFILVEDKLKINVQHSSIPFKIT